MKALLDSTIWDLPTQANMALIWMTRKGSWVQVPHGPPLPTWVSLDSYSGRSPGYADYSSLYSTQDEWSGESPEGARMRFLQGGLHFGVDQCRDGIVPQLGLMERTEHQPGGQSLGVGPPCGMEV